MLYSVTDQCPGALSESVSQPRSSFSIRGMAVRRKDGPVAQLGARFHGMEEVDGSNPSRSTKLIQENKDIRFWHDRFHAGGEVTGVHVESKLWTPGLYYRRRSVCHGLLNAATRADLCLTALWLRLPAGSQFLLCAPAQRVSGIIRRRGAHGAAGFAGSCDAQ